MPLFKSSSENIDGLSLPIVFDNYCILNKLEYSNNVDKMEDNSVPIENTWNMSEINGKFYSWFCIENVSPTECIISLLAELHDPLSPFTDYTPQLIVAGENDRVVHNGVFKWLTKPK